MVVKITVKRAASELHIEAENVDDCRQLLVAAETYWQATPEEVPEPATDSDTTGEPEDTPRREGRKRSARRTTPTSDAPEMRTKLKSLFEADPEKVASWAATVHEAPTMYKMHGILAFAKELGVDRLTSAEIRAVMNDILNLNLPEGTWTGNLAKAPPTEILKATGLNGKKEYRLVQGGLAAWENAIKKKDLQS